MKMIRSMIAAAALILSVASAANAQQSASATLPIVIGPAPAVLSIAFNPPTATEACLAPAGTVVSAVVPSGGDGNPISYTLSGDTGNFALDGNTPPNVVVGPNGINISACNPSLSDSVTVTATQP